MRRSQNTLPAFMKMAACALLLLGTAATTQAADKKADATGTWSWTMQPRGGGGGNANATPRKITLKLKADGEKLTGTVSQPGRPGQDGAAATPRETEISDGKVKGDAVSFSVKREMNGNTFVIKYSGKVEGDSLKGKIEMPGRDGGDPVSRDWEAKREVAEKK
jgi:hypothetical protein